MIIKNAIITCGQNLAGITKDIAEHRLTIQDFKTHYIELIKIYNQYFEIIKEFLTNIDNPEIREESNKIITKKLIECEIEAWRIYVLFKNRYMGFREFILFHKYFFSKDSGYSQKNKELRAYPVRFK